MSFRYKENYKEALETKDDDIPGSLEALKREIQTNVPDALRVANPITLHDKPNNTTIISGENFYDKKQSLSWGTDNVDINFKLDYIAASKRLSDDEFRRLFTGFADVRQGYFGDCYLVSTIKSIARSSYFKTLMVTSIEKNLNGSFNIYLPFGSSNSKKILITKEELNLAKIKGPVGYKILEVGFAKEALLRKNGSLLYTGEMPNIQLTDESMDDIVGGSSFNALAILLGYSNVKRLIISNKPERREQIISELKKFNPKNLNLILVSSRRRPKTVSSEQKTYTIGNETMYYHHAYSVYAVEKRGDNIESVILEDPANNKKKIKLPLLLFLSAFSQLTTCSPKQGFLPKIYN